MCGVLFSLVTESGVTARWLRHPFDENCVACLTIFIHALLIEGGLLRVSAWRVRVGAVTMFTEGDFVQPKEKSANESTSNSLCRRDGHRRRGFGAGCRPRERCGRRPAGIADGYGDGPDTHTVSAYLKQMHDYLQGAVTADDVAAVSAAVQNLRPVLGAVDSVPVERAAAVLFDQADVQTARIERELPGLTLLAPVTGLVSSLLVTLLDLVTSLLGGLPLPLPLPELPVPLPEVPGVPTPELPGARTRCACAAGRRPGPRAGGAAALTERPPR